jgi:hypothetical protein
MKTKFLDCIYLLILKVKVFTTQQQTIRNRILIKNLFIIYIFLTILFIFLFSSDSNYDFLSLVCSIFLDKIDIFSSTSDTSLLNYSVYKVEFVIYLCVCCELELGLYFIVFF